ncbi:elongation factor G [Thiohalorhabdus methylotrophus]|uniref:Elongation factor G n=1 Tax=Thiohalorhabdus methylotrophus TaxID=3242694 RepID=A0ABV4TXH4_9GAMM
MAIHETTEIRNIALVGHAGSGKTSLVEALLQESGAKTTAGEVERGSATTDFDPLERRYRHSLNLGLAGCAHLDRWINLIDTPGYPDFQAQTLAALTAAETMVVVVNAQTGIEPMTRRMMDWAIAERMPCMVVINKIDANGTHLGQLFDELTATYGKECLPLDLPSGHARQVVDVLGQRQGATDFSSVSEAHAALVEQVVEVDETAMERYLEEGDMDEQTLHAPFEQALREGHLIPVCFASARTGAGVGQLLEIFARLAPNPLEGNPHPFLRHDPDGDRDLWPQATPEAPLLAHVFKVEHDPFIGTLGFVRIHQGRLRKGDPVLIGPEGKTVKVAHLLRVQGKEHEEIDEAEAGDICAVAKVEELFQDAVLHADHEQDDMAPGGIAYPTPLVGLALKARRRGDQQKIAEVLQRLVAEDPGLRLDLDKHANETVLRGLGEFHLRVALEKLDERYHMEVDTRPPSIPYRETVTVRASGHYRHKKQTGGAGQFGEVELEVEPLERGAGFELVDRITGGAIPAPFIPAVEKGVRQALEAGTVAGYPVRDLRVTLTDGKHHPVDSKEVAFVTAGRKAFLEAYRKAAPVLLEPIADLEVKVPGAAMGDLSGELAARRARITHTGYDSRGEVTIAAQAPLAELEDFATRLKSLTGGEGSWTMRFHHYETAPEKLREALADRSRTEEV